MRQGVTPTDDPRTSPGTLHPLVCTHPETGRRMLYLGRRRNAYLDGLSLADSPRRCSTNSGTMPPEPELSWYATTGGSAIW